MSLWAYIILAGVAGWAIYFMYRISITTTILMKEANQQLHEELQKMSDRVKATSLTEYRTTLPNYDNTPFPPRDDFTLGVDEDARYQSPV